MTITSYLDSLYDSVSSKDKELPPAPSTPQQQPSSPTNSDIEPKQPLTPSQQRLKGLERKQAMLNSQHNNLLHVVKSLESLVQNNDTYARNEIDTKLDIVRRELSGVDKERMEVGILITRLQRKLDEEEGRGDRDSFIWSRKWAAADE